MKIRLLIIENNFKNLEVRASYQGSEILNKFPVKKASFSDYFRTNCCFETLSFSKKRVTTVTHINLPVFLFFGSLLYTGSPSQKFNSPWLNHSPFQNHSPLQYKLYLSLEQFGIKFFIIESSRLRKSKAAFLTLTW